MSTRIERDHYIQGYNDAAKTFLRKPPGDWKPFGSSIDPVTGKGPDYDLEFAGEDEGGMPIWERPVPGKWKITAAQADDIRCALVTYARYADTELDDKVWTNVTLGRILAALDIGAIKEETT